MRGIDKGTHRGFAELIEEVFQHGDDTNVATALMGKRQHVQEWGMGTRANPFDTAAVVIETLRRNGNPRADELFQQLSRRLGFISYRVDAVSVPEDSDLADAMVQFSDVLRARSEAEKDGHVDFRERKAIAHEASEAIERLAAYRDKQLRLAAEEEKPNVRRMA